MTGSEHKTFKNTRENIFSMKGKAHTATVIGIFANSILFFIKVIAALVSNSMAVISDAANSFADVFTSIVVYISVRVSHKRADAGHPFGHHRAQPIAGLIVAVVAGVLGFEVISSAITRLFTQPSIEISIIPITALIISILTKLIMAVYFRTVGTEKKSPAILASAVDSRNDVFASAIALLGIIGAKYSYMWFDEAAAMVVGLWILKSGYDVGLQNIDYLMGKAASPKMVAAVRKSAFSITGVKDIYDIRTHYVGNFINVQLTAEVDHPVRLKKSHKLSEKIREKVERLGFVDKAFVHMHPHNLR